MQRPPSASDINRHNVNKQRDKIESVEVKVARLENRVEQLEKIIEEHVPQNEQDQ